MGKTRIGIQGERTRFRTKVADDSGEKNQTFCRYWVTDDTRRVKKG